MLGCSLILRVQTLLVQRRCHSPAKSASTCVSSFPVKHCVMIMPLSCVPKRYLPILLTAFSCNNFGSQLYFAHWCTAKAISGLDIPASQLSFPIMDL